MLKIWIFHIEQVHDSEMAAFHPRNGAISHPCNYMQRLMHRGETNHATVWNEPCNGMGKTM